MGGVPLNEIRLKFGNNTYYYFYFYNKVDRRLSFFDCEESGKGFIYVETQCMCSIKTLLQALNYCELFDYLFIL